MLMTIQTRTLKSSLSNGVRIMHHSSAQQRLKQQHSPRHIDKQQQKLINNHTHI